MFDVECMEGEKPVQFGDVKYTSAQIQASFISSLYEWPFLVHQGIGFEGLYIDSTVKVFGGFDPRVLSHELS